MENVATTLWLDFIIESYGISQVHPFLWLISVQAEVIPAVLESAQQGLLIGPGGYKPRDICVSAPTGSGKTLAFVIPLIQVRWHVCLCVCEQTNASGECGFNLHVCFFFKNQVLMQRVICEVRALAVLPTKELAQQVRTKKELSII